VPDKDRYWTEPPESLSQRVEYWLRRLAEGSWTPNKYFNRECGQCRAAWLGVYQWEYDHIVEPALAGRADTP
jgi:hypothetical protein